MLISFHCWQVFLCDWLMFVQECSWRANAAHNKSSFFWLNDISSLCRRPAALVIWISWPLYSALQKIEAFDFQRNTADLLMFLRPSHPNSFRSVRSTSLLSFFSSHFHNCDASFAYFRCFFLESLSRRPGASRCLLFNKSTSWGVCLSDQQPFLFLA